MNTKSNQLQSNPSVVVIGGGTGTFTMLRALKKLPVQITALMTMVDDGGSNKTIRDEFGLLPTSGIRLAMVALSDKQTLLRELFLYRFHQGQGISGMTFGNLFLAAMADICGSQKTAIEETSKLLEVQGTIIPISNDDVRLVAEYEDGSEVMGEHKIDEPDHDGKIRITDMYTKPKATISADALQAISQADLIILGPGDFYTNTVANLVVDGVVDALKNSSATIIFVVNLMTKYGETYNYKASTYLSDLNHYFPLERLDAIVINNDISYSPELVSKYQQENSIPVEDDLDKVKLPTSTRIIRFPLISRQTIKPQVGDVLKRSIIRHDVKQLSMVIGQLLSTINIKTFHHE